MAPPPLPAPQPGFLWVRLRGGRCVLSLRTHQDRQGRSQRAASPHPEEPTAPEGARPADCTTAQGGTSAPHSLGFPELKEAGGFPRLCLGTGEGVGGGDLARRLTEPRRLVPPRNSPGLPEVGPWPSHPIMAHLVRDKPAPPPTHVHENKTLHAPMWAQGHTHTCTYVCTGPTGTHEHTRAGAVHTHTGSRRC